MKLLSFIACLFAFVLGTRPAAAQSDPEPESDSDPIWQTAPNAPSVQVPPLEPDGGFVPAGTPPCIITVGQQLTGQPIIAEEITPEISSLARNLENDPKRIYDYVHNYVKYVHYFGSKKGALLTYLEGSGNDFDQCALLVALLRAAAQNSGTAYAVTYQFGVMSIPYESANSMDVKHWLGFTFTGSDPPLFFNLVNNLNYKRGFPVYTNDNGFNYNVLLSGKWTEFFNCIMHRVWVKLVDGANTYYLDPAFKVSTPVAGIDIRSAMQLNTADVLSQAGVGMTKDANGIYVQDVNWNNITNLLTSYAGNLLADLQNQHPNYSVEQVIGGYQIQESETTSFGCLPFLPVSSIRIFPDGTYRTIPIQEWDNIPASYMSTMRMQIDNIDVTYRIPALKARKISLRFGGSGQAIISLDDVISRTGDTRSSVNATMVTTVDHPSGAWDYNANSITTFDHRTRQDDRGPVTGNGPLYQRAALGYTLVYGFDDPREQLTRRQKKLESMINQGVSPGSSSIITETLNVMGLSWIQQTYFAHLVLGQQNEVGVGYLHRVGRAAQEAGSKLGYYIDLKLDFEASFPRSTVPVSQIDDNSFKTFGVSKFFPSAMEHGVIEQLQTNPAVSTTKILYLANNNHQKLILGSPANSSTVSGYLQSEPTATRYTTAEQSSLLSQMNQSGATMFLPSGKITLEAWRGYGFALRLVSQSSVGFGMQISGGYNGGFLALLLQLTPYFPSSHAQTAPEAVARGPAALVPHHSPEPVNLLTGSFELDSGDITVGQTEPRGFSFMRHYDSNRRYTNLAHMANGWIHNYLITATERSDPPAGLGGTTPQQMATFLVAARAAYDVFTGTPDAENTECKRWAVAALIAQWAVDQLRSNAVNIIIGSHPTQFIKQPNGTYTPPAGITMTLTKPSGYRLQLRHGNTYNFDPAKNRIVSVVDQYGKIMDFTYDNSDRLSTVRDSWPTPRTLTLNYLGTPERLTSVSDGTGRSITLTYATTYSPQGDLVSATDPEGKVWRYEYDGDHKIIRTKDPTLPTARIVVEHDYDVDGKVTVQRSHGDTAKSWNFYVGGRATVQKNPAGGRTMYVYDEKGRLTAVRDANGNQSSAVYDGQDHPVQQITPKGEITKYEFDENHNLKKITDPLLKEATFTYDGQLRLEHAIDFRQKVTSYTYNTKHQIRTITKPNVNNDPAMPSVTTFNCNETTDGTIESHTDEDNKTTSFLYDGYGQMTRRTFPNTDYETFVPNTRGDIETHTDANGVTHKSTYNNRRQLTSATVVRPVLGNVVTSNIYDDAGNLWKTINPRGYVTENTYTPTRQLHTTILPELPQAGSPLIVNSYDNRDWLRSIANPLSQETIYGYDAAHRLTTLEDPLHRTATYGYDKNDQRTSVTTPLAEEEQTTHYDYNQRGELKTLTDADGYDITHSYDENGNRKTTINRNSGTFGSTYYDDNRLWTSYTPLGKTTTRTYNKRGLLASVTEPSLQTTTSIYDDRGRLDTTIDPIGTSTYTYDKNSNLRTHTENGKTITRTYDELNRIKSYTDENNNTIGYDYDDNGNLTRLTYPDLKQINYTYDSNDRLTTVTDWRNRVTYFTNDLAGRLTDILRPNGTVRRISYDDAGQTKKILELGRNCVPLALFKFGYDGAGRIKTELIAPIPISQTAAGPPMTYDADNRIDTFNINGETVNHDEDGNMTYGPLSSARVHHTYDARNRLTSVGTGEIVPALSYTYDSEGNRTGVTEGGQTTTFIINPSAALSQVLVRTKPNNSKTFYVYGHGLLYEVDESENAVYYHYDYRGSTVALTTDDGIITGRVEYNPYGQVISSFSTIDTPFFYNGRFGVQTDKNGLCYMRARYYNPWIRRFLNADPAGLVAGMNWYAYGDDNPISLFDPLGLDGNPITGPDGRVVGTSTPFAPGGAFHSWNYRPTDAGIRIAGGLRAVGGGIEALTGYSFALASGTFGVLSSETVVGAMLGGAGVIGGSAVGLHGVDTFQSGIRQVWTGEHVESVTAGALQSAGMSPQAANFYDAGFSFVGSLGAGLGSTAFRASELTATSLSANVVNAPLLTRMGYFEVGQLSQADDAYAFYSLWGNPLDRGAAMVADLGWRGAYRQGSLSLGFREGTLFTTGMPTPGAVGGVGGTVGAVANLTGQVFPTGK